MPTWEDEIKSRNLARKLREQEEARKEALEETRKCGNCGADVKMGDNFCWKCGNSLEGSWIKECKGCHRLFKTIRPKDREYCNRCEGEARKKANSGGLIRY